MKKIFLVLLIVVKILIANNTNVAHMKMPNKNNIVKIYGKILDDAPKNCKSKVALVFTNKEGFRDIYIGSDLSFNDLKSINFLQIYMSGSKKVVMCIFEKIFEINTSVEYKSKIMQSIFLWSPHVNSLKKNSLTFVFEKKLDFFNKKSVVVLLGLLLKLK